MCPPPSPGTLPPSVFDGLPLIQFRDATAITPILMRGAWEALTSWRGRGRGRGREGKATSSGRLASARALAKSLNDTSRCTLLSFYSPTCRLCHGLGPKIASACASQANWLRLVKMNVDDEAWVPEVSYYGISYVPCLVLLDRRNRARYKSAEPKTGQVVMESLGDMLRDGRRKFGGRRKDAVA